MDAKTMDLKGFFSGLTPQQQEDFAARCGTSSGHLRNVMYGQRSCNAALARRIEDESGKVVRRWSLRPKDWRAIWPELSRLKEAPTETQGETSEQGN